MVLKLIWVFLPIVRDIIRATKKKSDGGKKITPAEWEAILLRRSDEVLDAVNERLED